MKKLNIKNNQGFTIIELVVTIALLGIVSYYISARFSNINLFKSASVFDQVKTLIKLGQNTALAQKREIYPMVNNNELLLCYQNINPCPNSQKFTINNVPNVVNLTNHSLVMPNFHFNVYGNTNIGFTEIALDDKKLYIEEETGYIHE